MCRGACCLSDLYSYLPGTVLQGCCLLKRCLKLPARHCVAGVQAVQARSKPTCWALCCRGAVCLSSVRSNLLGTVLQGWRLFKRCQNLPTGQSVTGVQAVKAMSEPSCRAMCCRGAGCLSCVRIYLLGKVLQVV